MPESRRPRPWALVLTSWLLLAPWGQTTFASAQEKDPAHIELDPRQGQVGTSVTVTGGNFFPSETCGQVRVVFGSTPVGDATMTDPDADGLHDISHTFEVPEGEEPGPVTVTAFQSKLGPPSAVAAGCSRSAEQNFELRSVELDPSSGLPGSTTTARGAGFEPDVEECGAVQVSFGGELLASVTPLEDGTFTIELTVPDVSPGTHVVEANQGPICGLGGDIRADAPYDVLGPPRLAVDPAEGPADSLALATGTGFLAELPLVLEFDGEVVLEAPGGTALFVTASTFETPFTVPDRPPGSYVVVACQPDCDDPERLARTSFVVREGPALLLEPAVGPPGLVTRATGVGFPADSQILLRWEPGIGELVVQTDGSGAFAVQVLVFHNDRLGSRELRAELFAAPEPEEPTAPLASAEFVVSPGTLQPDHFSSRR